MVGGSLCRVLVLVLFLLSVRCIQEDQGPILAPSTNDTILTEYHTGTNHTLNCSVTSSSSPVSSFNITIPDSAQNNTNTIIDTDDFIQIAITNTTSHNNGRYTCIARNQVALSYVTYLIFVGGVPDAASVNVTITSSNSFVNVSVSFTDNSSVPATQVKFNIPNIPGSTYSRNFSSPLKGKIVVLPPLSINISNVSKGEYTLQVYASNQIGTVSIHNQTLTVYNDHHQSVLIALIFASVLAIISIAVTVSGIVASLYCIKKTKRSNQNFGDEDAFDDEEAGALQELIPKHSH